jgi:hypothetical protein
MPTVLRSGPYRFHFYSSDAEEPPHVHVERDENVATFWLTLFASRAAAASGRLKSVGFSAWSTDPAKAY